MGLFSGLVWGGFGFVWFVSCFGFFFLEEHISDLGTL